MVPRVVLVLLALGSVRPAGAAVSPPEELFFGLAGLEQRLVFTTPLSRRSGGLQLELLEVDRLQGVSGPRHRLVFRCTAASDIPLDFSFLGQVYATDAAGRALPATGATLVRDGAAWLTITVDGAETDSLQAVAASVGSPPPELTRVLPLALDQLGVATALADVQRTVRVALVRRESAALELEPDGPPYYQSLGSTLHPAGEVPEIADGEWLTLRLHSLRPSTNGGWRLANLRLTDGQTVFDDWSYIKREWRPDWGGWLGVKGRDHGADAAGRRVVGVELERVANGSPAARGGLLAGDLLTTIDGQPIADAYSLGDTVRRRAPGSTVSFEVRRLGRRLNVACKLGDQPLWPSLDELEFQQAWDALAARQETTDAVLDQWDWQTRETVPASFEPTRLELIFARPGAVDGTTFLFRSIPLTAKR